MASPLSRSSLSAPQVYMELEQGKNVDFWRDMTTITEDEIAKLRKLEASGKGPGERPVGAVGVWGAVGCWAVSGQRLSRLQSPGLQPGQLGATGA